MEPRARGLRWADFRSHDSGRGDREHPSDPASQCRIVCTRPREGCSISLASKRQAEKLSFSAWSYSRTVTVSVSPMQHVERSDATSTEHPSLNYLSGTAIRYQMLCQCPFARFFDYEPHGVRSQQADQRTRCSGGWLTHASMLLETTHWLPRHRCVVASNTRCCPNWRPRARCHLLWISRAPDTGGRPVAYGGPVLIIADGYLGNERTQDHHGHLLARAQQNIAIIR